jgi:hypothetical protein
MDEELTPEQKGFIEGIKLMTEYSLASYDFCRQLAFDSEGNIDSPKFGAALLGANDAAILGLAAIRENPDIMLNAVGSTRRTFTSRLLRIKNKEQIQKNIDEARAKEKRGE